MASAIVPYRDQSGALTPATPVVPGSGGDGGDRLDFRSLVAMFRRRIGVFLAVFFTVLVLGVLLTLMQVPSYTATASVALNVRPDQIAPVGQTDRNAAAAVPSEGYVDTQVQVITSEAMATKVAQMLQLASSPSFTQTPAPGGIRSWFAAKPKAAPVTRDEALQRAVRYLRGSVSAQRSGTTYALDISFQSDDPVEAARVANAYAAQYTQGGLVARRQSNEANLKLVQQRLDEVRLAAQADTDAVQRYRNATGLLTTSSASLTEQEIASYNQQVAAAKAQASEDDARLATARRQLRTGSSGDDVGESLGSSVVAALRTQQSTTQSKLADLTARYGNSHPDVIRARSELAAINASIQAEIRRIISNLEAKREVSQQRLASLTSTLNRSQGNLATSNRALPGLSDLEKRAETSQALYESYLNRYKELSAREGTEQADAQILTPAVIPSRPTSPNVLLNGVLALALGFGLGLAAAFLAEMSFSGITTGDDVERRLQATYLGSIPLLSSVMSGGRKQSPAAIVVREPRSAFAESFRSLRASIQFAGPRGGKVIAIASALPQEGKTTTAICLARSMALAGERVVLVDCDLRRHGVSRFLNSDGQRPGLVEVLRGEAALEDALIHDQQSGMSVLPVSPAGAIEAELLTGSEMDALLDKLRAANDAVVIDTAPVLPIADARLVLGKADLAVFAVRWRKTPDDAVRAAFRMLPADRVRLAGVVLTKVDMRKQARFGYGDDAFYYRAYKSYYA